MDRLLNRAELEAELKEKKDRIKARIDAVGDEVASTPAAVRDAVVRNPLWGIAGALAAGLLVGLVVTGIRRGRRDRYGLGARHSRLLDEYLDALVEDVRYRVAKGKEPGEALRRAMHNRAPIIVVSEQEESNRGFVAQMFDLSVKAATAFAVKSGLDAITSRYDLESLLAERDLEAARTNPPAAETTGETKAETAAQRAP